MRRFALALLGSALFVSSVASADESETPSGAPGAPGATIVVPAPTASSAMVRVHVRAYKAGEVARLYVLDSSERYRMLCTAPCQVELPVGALARVTFAESDEPHDFTVSGEFGRDMDVEVRPASKGPVAGGIVMISIGGVVALVGAVLTAVAAESSHSSDVRTGGFITLGIGAGLTLGGIALISGRSHEPRIRQTMRGNMESRATRFTDDVAVAAPRDPSLSAGPAFPAFGGTF